jgi:hypothetical protein
LALALGLVGLFISLQPILFKPPPPPQVQVLAAAQDIDTYKVVTMDLVNVVTATQTPGLYTLDEVWNAAEITAIGEMTRVVLFTTRPVQQGEILSRRTNVLPIEEARYAPLRFEVASFLVDINETVGGQVKPGHRINIYGYIEERQGHAAPPVQLIAENVWVVDVRTAQADLVAPTPAPATTPQAPSGPFGVNVPGLTVTTRAPEAMITVAADPETIWRILEALGAQGFRAWVTLSPG